MFAIIAAGVMREKKRSAPQNLMAFSEQAATENGPVFLHDLPKDYADSVAEKVEEIPIMPTEARDDAQPAQEQQPRRAGARAGSRSRLAKEKQYYAADNYDDERYVQEDREARRSGILFDHAAPASSSSEGETYEESDNSQAQDLLGRSSDKHGFLNGGKNVGRLTPSRSAFAITQGTIIPAVLLSKINSDLPGPILGRVSENIFDSKTGKSLIIPQGSKLIGEYNSNVSFGQSRAQVVWTRVIFPNTESVDLGRMPGIDKQGTSGHKGKADQHWDQVAAGIIFSTLLSAGAAMAQPPNGGAGQAVSPQQQLSQSLAQNVNQVGAKIADRSLNTQPTITVASGTRISVFVMKDLELKAYSK